MPNTVQEVYREQILPLSESERLRLAALIISDISKEKSVETKKTENISEMFGTWKSGNPNSADNEQIDIDLGKAYADNHEDE